MEKIVTSYSEPDLDGVSSSYAYSEYLNKIGIKSNYFIDGVPKKEVAIVCDLFNIILDGEKQIHENQDVIIVDTNGPEEFSFVNPKNVIEIIDHHTKNKNIDKCINANIHIEMIGAVATLIAEKFKNNNVPISRNSAILLYYGIISNSINLKGNSTVHKDIEISNWLKEQCDEITEEKIEEIFILKSKIEDKNLRTEMEAEISFDCGEGLMTIAQLEIANVEEFLNINEEKIIKILKRIKEEKSIKYILINCVDILNGYNLILTIDDETERVLNKILGYKFENRRYKNNKIMQRKHLIKNIKESLN